MATATAPKKAKPVDARAIQRAAILLKMSSDPTRIRVLCMLADEPRNVGGMSSELGQSQPATSHHLGLMRHSGLVEVRREGKTNVYSLTPEGRSLAATARKLVDAAAGW